jgi:hypothetical protein
VLRVDIGLVALHLVLLFIGGLLCHTALAESRPDPRISPVLRVDGSGRSIRRRILRDRGAAAVP